MESRFFRKTISLWSSAAAWLCGKVSFSAFGLPLLILLVPSLVAAQAGGHTLFGDIKVDESQTSGLKPLSLQVLLYSESGDLLYRQTIPSNGRYRFLDLRDGRYQVVVDVENVEIARVLVTVRAPFKTDFRQDLEFQWHEKAETGRAEVVSAYTEALKRHPEYAVVLISLGRVRIVRKDFDGAIKVLAQAVAIQPTSPQANYFLGEAYLQARLGSKAVPFLNEAIKLDPAGMAEAHLRLAALYNARGLKDKAAAEYEAFLKQIPDYYDKKKLKEYIAANKKL